MAEKTVAIPFCWHEQVPQNLQEIVTRRRHTYVKGAEELEQEGYFPITQVTMASGRLLRVGDPDVRFMVEGRVKVAIEKSIREDPRFQGQHLDIRFAEGTIVPLVDPHKITGGKHFRASRRGFTAFAKVAEPPLLVANMAQEPESVFASLGSSTATTRRVAVPSVFYSFE